MKLDASIRMLLSKRTMELVTQEVVYRREAQDGYPHPPEPDAKCEHLEQRSRERGGPERDEYQCLDGLPDDTSE